ncbi:MAG TPA: undecaprenyl-diphosphate phosphatase [Pseudogracilibacillus sp.]|nr:undecaprenyl-diphosphate phosphatase [Pseudogracilibacillus sp.]
MDIRDLFVAIILGFIEGLTEFLPVSSTGHMIIFDDILLQSHVVLASTELANTFKVVIQFASVLAVVLIFWERFLWLFKRNSNKANDRSLSMLHFAIALFPAVILGLLFESFIDRYLFRVETVIIGLFLGAILMLAADRFAEENNQALTAYDDISYRQAFFIGLYQCLALWPGFSRSGATISGGVMLGLNYRAAADFTFMMAVPIMFGASGLSLYKKWSFMTGEVVPFFMVGFISAFFFAFISIRFFLVLIEKVKLKPFALYRIVVAIILTIILFLN